VLAKIGIAAFVCVIDKTYNILLEKMRGKRKDKAEMSLQQTMVEAI